jgi:hypothetical protein
MAFSQEHLYLTFGGDLPGAETWQCGLRMASETPATYGPTYDHPDLADKAAAVLSWFQSSDAGISPRCTLTFVKEAVIGTDGDYIAPPDVVEYSPPELGSSSPEGGVVPNQIALVVTLLTGTSFGDAQRGRIYTPMPAVQITEAGVIGDTTSQDRADAAAALITALNGIPTGLLPERVVVMSRKGSGTTRAVTSVSVGNVLDTHRSRRTSLVESRFSADV